MSLYNITIEEIMKEKGASWYKFDEEGSSIVDSKGLNNGTLYSGATRVIGWNGEGYALNFNRTATSYVDFNNQIIPLGNYTIRFKMKLNAMPTVENQEILSCSFATADHYGLRVWIDTNGLLTFTSTRKVSNSWDFTLTSPVLFDDAWHDYILTWDATNRKVYMYIDEIEVANGISVTQNTTTYTYNLRIGNQRRAGENRYFEGQLDELQIYNYALSPNDFILKKSLIFHNGEYKRYEDVFQDWAIVSSTTPSTQQFLSDGIDSLSPPPLLDRKVTELNPMKMSIDNSFTEEGKLFKKTIGLNKYFDIRNVKVEVD